MSQSQGKTLAKAGGMKSGERSSSRVLYGVDSGKWDLTNSALGHYATCSGLCLSKAELSVFLSIHRLPTVLSYDSIQFSPAQFVRQVSLWSKQVWPVEKRPERGELFDDLTNLKHNPRFTRTTFA